MASSTDGLESAIAERLAQLSSAIANKVGVDELSWEISRVSAIEMSLQWFKLLQ